VALRERETLLKEKKMEQIASFTVNHLSLEPGVYVSRVDQDPQTKAIVTTFDIRLTCPNREPVMSTAACHTLEHLGATYLRNDPVWSKQVIYFGPMGCRTGFYLVLFGSFAAADVIEPITRTFEFVRDFSGGQADIPGARVDECGNYLDHNLAMAQWHAKRFLDETLYCIDAAHMTYPA
jgi:S-ribosylhomocysteine lyase